MLSPNADSNGASLGAIKDKMLGNYGEFREDEALKLKTPLAKAVK